MSFLARYAAAMQQFVCRNCMRLKPRCLPFTSASSLIRASTFFCVALCGGGRYSPLETIWVGIGVAADAAAATATRRCSRSLSQVPMVLLPFCWPSTVQSVLVWALRVWSLPISQGVDRRGVPSPVRLSLKPSHSFHLQARQLVASAHETAGTLDKTTCRTVTSVPNSMLKVPLAQAM